MGEFSARLAEINERHKAAKIKRDREFFQLLALHFVVIVVGISFFFFTVPDAQRQALRNQEVSHVVSR